MPQATTFGALVREFLGEPGRPARTRARCAYAELEPWEVLAAVRGTTVAWALRSVPGTQVDVVGSALVGVRP